MRHKFIALLMLVFGIMIGGYSFSDTRARPLWRNHQTVQCFNTSALLGLIASVGIQRTPGLLPNVVYETDKTIVLHIKHPLYKKRYVFIPKKDIKHIGDYTEEDKAFIVDLHASVVAIVQREKIKKFKFWSNGPGYQEVNYLHYHLGVEKL